MPIHLEQRLWCGKTIHNSGKRYCSQREFHNEMLVTYRQQIGPQELVYSLKTYDIDAFTIMEDQSCSRRYQIFPIASGLLLGVINHTLQPR
ncbi:hypothetical protein TNIN_394521 [Trichonephila inaurata madagascariensis]|uniref:Uncharacterized protein n=1 Tax=Trichonephila inaurata madagascariensis TaxID=2747483 RepID=A0A8X6IRH3_9ARAC|nr:hypothetical protein TNIN_394521 [Trichonephila inaurata madagascariensis]